MSEWKEYKLGEVCSRLRSGKNLKSNSIFPEGKYPVWGGNGIRGYTSESNFKGKCCIIGRQGAYCGNVHFFDGEAYMTEHAIVAVGNELADTYYLSCALSLMHLENLSAQSAQPGISVQTLAKQVLSLPPIEEQRRIAGVLSSLDDKIDLLNRENATLEALAETLFRHYFIENPNPTWKEGKLGDVAKIGIGRTPPRKETKWFSTSSLDVKWISIKDMGEQGVFIFNTTESLTNDAVETFKIPIIPPNTVVLSFKMTVGRIGITSEAMLSNEAIAHFILDDNSPISKEYLYIFLKLFKYETLGSTSSIVTSINSAMIKEMDLIIPDKDAMMLFNKQVRPLFEKIKTNQQQIISLSSQRDTLLPYLMYENMVK